jgi:hypothetical protein
LGSQASTWDIAGIIAVAPTFADAIIGAMDTQFSASLLGKRTSSLNSLRLSAMNRSGTLIAGSDVRPGTVGAVSHMSVFCHGGDCPFYSIEGFTSKQKCLTFPAACVVQSVSRL